MGGNRSRSPHPRDTWPLLMQLKQQHRSSICGAALLRPCPDRELHLHAIFLPNPTLISTAHLRIYEHQRRHVLGVVQRKVQRYSPADGGPHHHRRLPDLQARADARLAAGASGTEAQKHGKVKEHTTSRFSVQMRL
jgi:hypothetical protein